MFEELKERVYKANIELVQRGVVIYTWGNVSEIDRTTGCVAIKPSGVSYETMRPEDMVIVDLETGKVVEGNYKPSSDTYTHLEIYKAFPEVVGIAHTHSINAVAFAQAGKDIPALGTTHADYFYGDIPCTRDLTKAEVDENYELNTGRVIVECIKDRGVNPIAVPGIIVKNHGPFSWGLNAEMAVHNAVVMEVVSEMSIKTLMINSAASIPEYILDKHYFRKHGKDAYYGQKE